MNALMIANTQIRRDVAGRFCLNDLHQASGGEAKRRPNYWLELEGTKSLIAQVVDDLDDSDAGIPAFDAGIPASRAPVVSMRTGLGQGTYVVKDLVYAYAMWISPRFHLHVIRAYDAMVTSEVAAPPAVPAVPMHRADVMVSAARNFGALVRVGRIMGMHRGRAVLSANAATLRCTGIDLINEMDPDGDMALHAPPLAAPIDSVTDQIQQAIAGWIDGVEEATIEQVITGALAGDPDSKELQTRAGIALRRLGWVASRKRRGDVRVRLWGPVKVRWGASG